MCQKCISPTKPAAGALRKVGADLTATRKRRQQTLRAWLHGWMFLSLTLMKMEKGGAAESISVLITALWINVHLFLWWVDDADQSRHISAAQVLNFFIPIADAMDSMGIK